MVRSKAC